jgi:hypothetical protein
MMTDCFSSMNMNGMGWMMWGAALFWLLGARPTDPRRGGADQVSSLRAE